MADEIATWALVIFTFALFVVTGYYAIQTRELARLQNDTLMFEQEKLKVERRPELFLTMETVGLGGVVSPMITNVGKTPAKDILIEINGIPGTAQERSSDPSIMGKFFGRWIIPTMLSGEARILNVVKLDLSNLGGLYAIEMKATMYDLNQIPVVQSPQLIPTIAVLDELQRTAPQKIN
jgi:hypothetical protein